MKKIFTILLNLLTVCLLAQQPIDFAFEMSPSSGTMIGQIQINGFSASNDDWIAAFDESGNCCGASQLNTIDGISYMDLSIYGDDTTTVSIDEGINEVFNVLNNSDKKYINNY